ncbi:MAG TPA: hypothetical protein PK657_03025 [Legionella sp.]|nr:hypothetical protein [Legionella sp.]
MANIKNPPSENRYGFLGASRSGHISQEHAHSTLLRLNSLLEKTGKAATFKKDNPDNESAVKVLLECHSTIHSIVNGTVENKNAVITDETPYSLKV